MKKLLLNLLYYQFAFFSSAAQSPLVKMWDKTFGGNSDDIPVYFQQTSDAGFIIGGYTYSDVGGDKTEPLKNAQGIVDFWIVKTDSLGNKQWDKDFGGANGDQLNSLQQTSDGGYILGGMSASIISGDKTSACWGNWDYWILKLDPLGNILWDKDFGGTSSDQLISLKQTTDGGYILAGNSASDSSGDKSQHCRGAQDYWVVKTDSLGNKQWDRTFGGMDADKLFDVRQTSDGGYILGGSSSSYISGDKTEDVFGIDDYWVVKIDSLGNKEWDKDFGGTDSDILYSLLQTSDGGYILGGRSGSDVSGNKTQPLWGGYDFWIVKINSLGIKIWDKSYGGTQNEDEFGNVSLTDDGGYLIAGTSYSPVSGNKTESNMGQEQSWFLKLDSLFDIQWDKTVFTACHDEIGMAIQTTGQCYAVVNSNGPSCTTGGYRTQESWNGSRDYWIVKFCDSTYFPPAAAAGGIQALCPGTCTSFTNLSVNSVSWQWNFPGATPDTSSALNPSNICYGAPGNYDVTLVASNSHGSTDTLTLPGFIVVYPYPAAQGIVQHDDTLLANTGATSYQWYFTGNAIAGATDYFYVATQNGDYNMIATDVNGCEVEAAIYSVITNLPGSGLHDQVEFFPNPFSKELYVASEKPAVVEIKNIFGETVFTVNAVAGHENEMDLDFLSRGVYLLRITTGEKSNAWKIVKE